MKTKIAEKQLIGDGLGYAHFRDLYEDENGKRESVPVSRVFWMQDQRKLGESYDMEAIFRKFEL